LRHTERPQERSTPAGFLQRRPRACSVPFHRASFILLGVFLPTIVFRNRFLLPQITIKSPWVSSFCRQRHTAICKHSDAAFLFCCLLLRAMLLPSRTQPAVCVACRLEPTSHRVRTSIALLKGQTDNRSDTSSARRWQWNGLVSGTPVFVWSSGFFYCCLLLPSIITRHVYALSEGGF
jgi:hypothetical protein